MASMEPNNSTGSVLNVGARLGPPTRALSPWGIRVALLAALALATVLAGLALWPAPATRKSRQGRQGRSGRPT